MQNPQATHAREIRFSREGRAIHPRDLFSYLYLGLEEIVAANRSVIFASSRAIGHRKKRVDTKELLAQWTQQELDPITADITFDDGKKVTHLVQRRTNFERPALIKFPSIAYLQDPSGKFMMLREARRYPYLDFLVPLVRKGAGNMKFDGEATSQFYSEEPVSVHAARRGYAMYVPEPQLLVGLERLYREKGVLPRISPPVAALDADSDKLWYLRDYFARVLTDVPVSREIFPRLGTYFGTLYALGLMEFLDRQGIHYGFRGDHIQNYDLDPILHTSTEGMIEFKDWDDLKREMAATSVVFENRGPLRDLKESINEVRTTIQTDYEVTPQSLVGHLPSGVTMDPFHKVELIL